MVISGVCPPTKVKTPAFERVNLVVPEADAAIMSPEFSWSTTNAAFEPMPPEIDNGAGVFVDAPILTPVLKSETKVTSAPVLVRVSEPSEANSRSV